ncbi:hypothetical protein F8568_010650 [Actinomadura sp. LD22]|uniref:Uncharacterized protein n=1 Tax=Actinomadura physcomitrii TaxID=2650748 RepID=A0A6I4MAK3_9ACTN|nr:hypothetical protein [Actinomadura physcomitrii]MWA00831.1 hypothetical protein [Actinomadura physcomitrii]
MRPLDQCFDVTEKIGTGEPLSQTAWILAPEDAEVKGAILCLAFGTYDKRYYHNFAGRRRELWHRLASWGDTISARRGTPVDSLKGDVE